MTMSPLTHDQQKAAEAAFRGLPLNPQWSDSAQEIYRGIVAATKGRDIIEETASESELLALAVGT
jgi:hypothetical protein